MRGVLVRVGIDHSFGGWNAPIDPRTGEFVYVPIPDGEQRPGMETGYWDLLPALKRFPGMPLPANLHEKATHLDPDFQRMSYGDNGIRRGKSLARLESGDVVAFFSGLRPVSAWHDPLLYALIGVYRVAECVRLATIPAARWGENAHTRRQQRRADDIIVRGEPTVSGRLRRCIVIGEWRDRAYRVKRDILEAWGGLSCKDGYIQRSAVPPQFNDAARFVAWFERQTPELVAANNP